MKKINGKYFSDVFAKEANVLTNDYGVKLKIDNVNSDYDVICEEIIIEGVLTVDYDKYLRQLLYKGYEGSFKLSFSDLINDINLFNDTGIYEISRIELWPENCDKIDYDEIANYNSGRNSSFDELYYDPNSNEIKFAITLYKI